MKPAPVVGLLLALAGWALLLAAGLNMLSGHMDTRTCQTACVSRYFWGGAVAAGLAFVLSLIGLARKQGRGLASLAVLVALPLFAVFTTIIGVGVAFS